MEKEKLNDKYFWLQVPPSVSMTEILTVRCPNCLMEKEYEEPWIPDKHCPNCSIELSGIEYIGNGGIYKTFEEIISNHIIRCKIDSYDRYLQQFSSKNNISYCEYLQKYEKDIWELFSNEIT